MGFLTEIFGAKTGQPTVEEAEAKLARFRSERERAFAEIERLRAKRKTLLADDEPDAAIRKVDDTIEAVELRLERLDLAEPALVAELTGARDKRRRAQWEKIKASYFPAAANYLRAARLALQEYETVIKIRTEGLGAGFSTEVNSIFAVPPWAIKADLINAFEVEVERASMIGVPAIAAPKPEPKPVLPPSEFVTGIYSPVDTMFAPKAAPAGASAKVKPAHERIAKAKPAPVAAPVEPKLVKQPTKAARERVVEPAGPGQVQARVQRSGYEANGRQYAEGDIVALSAEKARVAIANGALDGAL